MLALGDLPADHPGRDEGYLEKHETAIDDVYRRMDSMVGDTLDRMGDETLMIVMSDHGFTSWRRTFHLIH